MGFIAAFCYVSKINCFWETQGFDCLNKTKITAFLLGKLMFVLVPMRDSRI